MLLHLDMTANGKPAEIIDALFTRATLMETSGPNLPVNVQEGAKPFSVPANGQYLKVSIFPNVPKWQGISDGVMKQGLFQVMVVWPKSQGIVPPANKVGAVMEHFPKGLLLYSGNTVVKISGEPWESGPLPMDDEMAIPVTIPYTA